MRTGMALGILFVAALVAVTGLGFCLWGLFLWLQLSLGTLAAATVTGAIMLLLALVLAWLGLRTGR